MDGEHFAPRLLQTYYGANVSFYLAGIPKFSLTIATSASRLVSLFMIRIRRQEPFFD